MAARGLQADPIGDPAWQVPHNHNHGVWGEMGNN